MNFTQCTDQKDFLIKLFEEHFWSYEAIREVYGFCHQHYGYKKRNALRQQYEDATSKDFRFRPDCLLASSKVTDSPVIRLEYKSTTTPCYKEGSNQWNVGQFEAAPWEHYIQLAEGGSRVALLNYCSYHARPLLCDFVSKDWVIRLADVMHTTRGSGTRYAFA